MLAGALACAAPDFGHAEERITPWQFGARAGDCTSDASAALGRAAAEAVRRAAVLWTGDSCLAIGATFVPPPGLIWRSDFADAHRLIWIGPRDGDVVEVRAAINMDGIVIDGGRSPRLDRIASTRAGNDGRALLAIHGSMVPDAPDALHDVKIGRVRVQNSGWSTGVLAVNVHGLRADRIEARGIWGVATMWAGLSDSQIGTIFADDTGQLGKEGGRAGQVVAIYAETDPRKRPGKFFSLLDPARPSRQILPTTGLRIGQIETRANTDTAVYIHDYPGGRTGQGIGIGGIAIGSITGALVGKDLFKVRHYAGDVTVGSVTGNSIGARLVSVEDFAHDVTIQSASGRGFGFDVVGAMTGHPAPFDGQDHGAGIGFGQTLSTNAAAITVIGGARNVAIAGGSVQGVAPLWNGINGYGLQIGDATGVSVRLSIADTAGAGLRMANSTGFTVDVDVSNACLTSGTAAVLLADDGKGPVHHGRLTYAVRAAPGAGRRVQNLQTTNRLQAVTIAVKKP